MFRKKFRAEPAIALTVLYAALSLSARANVPRQDELQWPQAPEHHSVGLQVWPDERAAAMVGYDAQMVRSVQLTGVTRYSEGMFDPYLNYLARRPLSMSAVDTVVQAISAHYRADGLPSPRIFACVDNGSAGHLIVAVFEA